MTQKLKCLPPMWETQVHSLGQEDPLEKEMVSHSSILAWRIPWTEKPGWLYSIGSQRVRHDQAINTSLHFTRDIVQEAVIKTIPKKNKCKKAKWLSEKDLQKAKKTREAKGKGEKEI